MLKQKHLITGLVRVKVYEYGHRGRGHQKVSLTPEKCCIHQGQGAKETETQIRLSGETMSSKNGPSTGGFLMGALRKLQNNRGQYI